MTGQAASRMMERQFLAEQDRAGPGLFEPVGRYVLALIYAIIMVALYRSLSVYWTYLGFAYRALGPVVAPLLVLSATPALLLPGRPKSVAQFAAWLLYFILFLPALIIPQLQGWVRGWEALALFSLTLASTYLFIALGRLRTIPLPLFRFDRQLFWLGLVALWIAMHGSLYLFFGEQLQFAQIGEQVYEQRADAALQLGSGYIVYIITNASGAVNPLLIALGFFERRWWALGLGIIGQLIVYSTIAGKIVLLFPMIIIGTFFLFDRQGSMRPTRFGLTIVGIAIVGIPLQLARGSFGDTLIQVVDLVYMRTLYLPGVLVGAYHDFFSIYPLTYFSHSIVGRLFIEYPYGTWSVGQVVGAYVTPGTGYTVNNYNANFLAADGIAGLGLLGIPLITAITIMVLRLFDKLLGHLDLRLRCAAFAPFLMWLADGSLLTALVTGGGILVTILLWLYAGTAAYEHHLQVAGEGNFPAPDGP